MSAQTNTLPERATDEQMTDFLQGFQKLSGPQREVILKLAFNHVSPVCRDTILLYVETVADDGQST